MVMNNEIRILVTREQRENIKKSAEENGFNSLSAFIRFVALNTFIDVRKKWK